MLVQVITNTTLLFHFPIPLTLHAPKLTPKPRLLPNLRHKSVFHTRLGAFSNSRHFINTVFLLSREFVILFHGGLNEFFFAHAFAFLKENAFHLLFCVNGEVSL